MIRVAGNIAHAIGLWVGLAGLAVAIWSTGVMVGAGLQPWLTPTHPKFDDSPVVVGWHAEAFRSLDGATILHIAGTKVRRRCKYIRDDMQVVDSGGVAHDVASIWDDDPTPGSTRHIGRQDFGAMRLFTARSTPAGSKIIGIVRSQCHDGPETETPIFGEGFVVPPLPAE